MTDTTFEDRLLAELRALVAERPASAAAGPPPARRVPRRRLAFAAGAVVAAVAGVFVAVDGDPAAPAYAVDRHSDGSVTVEIHGLRDAAGLQAKLRAAGIPAVVDYAPAGKMCREPRGRRATGRPTRGRAAMGVGVGQSTTFTIPRGQLQPGQTLVITSSTGSSVSSVSTQIVEGPVAPCELVDAPPLPAPGSTSGKPDSGPSFSTGGAKAGGARVGPSTHTGP
jgi:hypothetical protein